MATPFADQCRGKFQPTLDLAYELTADGFGLSERDGSLVVRHPDGRALDEARRARVRQDKEYLLALIRTPPMPDFPIGWEQEWRLEMDALARRAAAMRPGELREEMLALSREQAPDQDSWLILGLRLRDLEHRVRESRPGGELPPAESFTPWRGWVRVGGKAGQWRETEAVGDTWDDCMAALLRVEVAGDQIERLCRPEGRHPDQRRRPR